MNTRMAILSALESLGNSPIDNRRRLILLQQLKELEA